MAFDHFPDYVSAQLTRISRVDLEKAAIDFRSLEVDATKLQAESTVSNNRLTFQAGDHLVSYV